MPIHVSSTHNTVKCTHHKTATRISRKLYTKPVSGFTRYMWIDDHIWIRFILNLFFFHTNTCEKLTKTTTTPTKNQKFNTSEDFSYTSVLILHSHRVVGGNIREWNSSHTFISGAFLHPQCTHKHQTTICFSFANDMIKYDEKTMKISRGYLDSVITHS